MHPEKSLLKNDSSIRMTEKDEGRTANLFIKGYVTNYKQLQKQDFIYMAVKGNRNLYKAKIFLNYYLIIMSEILTTAQKLHPS